MLSLLLILIVLSSFSQNTNEASGKTITYMVDINEPEQSSVDQLNFDGSTLYIGHLVLYHSIFIYNMKRKCFEVPY